MINDKGILIKNVYYMLTYAFQVLNQSNYDEIASEEFDNILELFAEIMSKAMAKQLKQGLHKEYVVERENLSVKHGKIDFPETIKNVIQKKRMLYCEYDDLSVNNIYNQILKTTCDLLLRQKTISLERRSSLKKVMQFMQEVDLVDPSTIHWNTLKYQRNNQTYKMLINLCYFILEGLLLTTEKGEHKMATFLDDLRMSNLYERFVLEYYKHHYKNLNVAASQVKWAIDDGMMEFLPKMQSDITIWDDHDNVLIIDAKYYSHTMQEHALYDTKTIHSNNLYQIFAYVKNKAAERTQKVSGMLLYAKTEEAITPDCDYQMSNNKISVKTLDLNKEFTEIAVQLDQIVTNNFENC